MLDLTLAVAIPGTALATIVTMTVVPKIQDAVHEFFHPTPPGAAVSGTKPSGVREMIMTIDTDFQAQLDRFESVAKSVEDYVEARVAAAVAAATDTLKKDKAEAVAALQGRLDALSAILAPKTAVQVAAEVSGDPTQPVGEGQQ